MAEAPTKTAKASIRTVSADEADLRLDRWFKRHFPDVGHGLIERLLRTGQIRLDGGRVKAGVRLAAGQEIRVPPLDAPSPGAKKRPIPVAGKDTEALRASVLYQDGDVIAINKPPGLAVQGGTGTPRHLDAMLDALREGRGDRPRLVHRLDKDTSGVLLLARSAGVAAKLAAAFRKRDAAKVYWAVVVGVPRPNQGEIRLALSKQPGPRGERMVGDEEGGKWAVTRYRILARAGRRAAWLSLMPETGRTHQLRVHCAAIGTPIAGDGKYGGNEAYLAGSGISRKLHLHATAIRVPHPAGGVIEVTAPPPAHMTRTLEFLGFDLGDGADPFAGFE